MMVSWAKRRSARSTGGCQGPAWCTAGEFNLQNLLVARQRAASQWHLATILDWEFAFSGAPAFDLSNLIRPPLGQHDGFVAAFAAGYQESGESPASGLAAHRTAYRPDRLGGDGLAAAGRRCGYRRYADDDSRGGDGGEEF